MIFNGVGKGRELNNVEAILFIGLQASGKTSFYKSCFFNTHIRLSSDMLKTRLIERALLNACLKSKQPFVVDNTNASIVARSLYIDSAKNNQFSVSGYYFKSSLIDCLYRNSQRLGKEKMSDESVKGTHEKLDLPSYNEGFDKLAYVTLQDGTFVVEAWNSE